MPGRTPSGKGGSGLGSERAPGNRAPGGKNRRNDTGNCYEEEEIGRVSRLVEIQRRSPLKKWSSQRSVWGKKEW